MTWHPAEPPESLRSIAKDLAPRFDGIFSQETVAKYLDEAYAALAANAHTTTHLPIFAERFAREQLTALAQAEGAIVSSVPEVLYVCIHNAGRSIAAAVLTDHYAQGRVHVRSAGSQPGSEVNAAVAQVLRERGLDPDQQFPKPLTDEAARAADVIVTMGCGDACPVYPGKRYLDWELTDPAGKSVEEVRPIIDHIDDRVRQLLAELLGEAVAYRPSLTRERES
jgi:arsenate reductase (thioredoxin)